MITAEQLEVCANKLFVYDVLQDGWEQEHNGAPANMAHVLTHLVKDLKAKDFRKRDTVQGAIAPDHLQYAIRFARWTGQSVADFILGKDVDDELKDIPVLTHSTATGQLRHIAAAVHIAENSHGTGHKAEEHTALAQQPAVALHAGGLLLRAADVQATVFDFDLVEAFDARLAALRARFGIPTPDFF